MKRNILTATTFFAIIIGMVMIAVPFAKSMKPSEKARNARSQHDISNLKAGDFIFEKFKRDSAWNEKVLIIKDWDGRLFVYLVPTRKGKVLMPERFWGLSNYECNDFRPELDEKGKIRKGGIITCHDSIVPDWGKNVWKWSYDGKSNHWLITKMYSPSFEVSDDTLYLNR